MRLRKPNKSMRVAQIWHKEIFGKQQNLINPYRQGIGGVAERTKAHDSKSCFLFRNGGSNPSPSGI